MITTKTSYHIIHIRGYILTYAYFWTNLMDSLNIFLISYAQRFSFSFSPFVNFLVFDVTRLTKSAACQFLIAR